MRQLFEQLSAAITEVRLTDGLSTAREVHEELIKSDRWSGLTLAEVKKTSSKMAKAQASGSVSAADAAPGLATKTPASSDVADPESMLRGRIDPDNLRPWPGLGSPPLALIDNKHQPLAYCFREAVPEGTQIALGTGRTQSDISPHALWKAAMYDIAGASVKPHAYRCGAETRNDRDGSIVIDFLTHPLACPAELPTHNTTWKDEPGQAAGVASREPLILVRYMFVKRTDSKAMEALIQTMPPGVSLNPSVCVIPCFRSGPDGTLCAPGTAPCG